MKPGFFLFIGLPLWAGPLRAQVPVDDYPPLALRMNHQGKTRYHAEYDADGHMADCKVTKSSGYDELDAQTCRSLTRRALAQPQAPGPHDGTFTWTIPRAGK